MSTRAGTVRI